MNDMNTSAENLGKSIVIVFFLFISEYLMAFDFDFFFVFSGNFIRFVHYEIIVRVADTFVQL